MIRDLRLTQFQEGYTTNCLKKTIALRNSSTKAHAYATESYLKIDGEFTATLKANDREIQAKFHVISNATDSLLSCECSLLLGLVEINNTPTVSLVTENEEVKQMLQRYNIFEGIGKLKDCKIMLHINENIKPMSQTHRRQPFHTRKKVEAEIEKLLQQDIIEKASGPTPWISPIVTPPKKGNSDEVRICIDMREANKAIERERHPVPTLEEIRYHLNNAKFFSKLDLNKGYHQLELDERCRYITTFATHQGLYRYKRLGFGINSAAEIFQNSISEVLKHIPGALNISDDILIFGKTKEEHNDILENVLKSLKENNLTLNKSKCQFLQNSVKFFGCIFNENGMQPDPDKVDAVKAAKEPKNEKALRSFLGLVSYCSNFIPDFSTETKLLRDLTKKNQRFSWTKDHQDSFNKIKTLLTEKNNNAHFRVNSKTELAVDASPVGLAAILAQYDENGNRDVIAYGSRALTAVEQRYSQTEKEALAIVWGCEHFHIYLYGSSFTTVITDHKPLQVILNNARSKPPARIERWLLRLQSYNFSVMYKSGADNPADYMSRHPTLSKASNTEISTEQYIHAIVQDAIPKALTMDIISEYTSRDEIISKLIEKLKSNKTNATEIMKDTDLQAYKKVIHELSLSDCQNILLKGSKIVIPDGLRKRTIMLAHNGHQGIVKTKQLLREKVWFPGIDEMTESIVRSCKNCQVTTTKNNTVPLTPNSLPPHRGLSYQPILQDLFLQENTY